MSLCVDCKAAGIDAVAIRKIGKLHYCSSHARKYFPMGAALPPENPHIEQIEEETMSKRLDPQAILADHKAGMSDVEIAKKYGCHFTSVSKTLLRLGVRRRDSDGRKLTDADAVPVPKSSATKGIDRAAIVFAHRTGMSQRQIAEKHGCSQWTVRYHLKEAGELQERTGDDAERPAEKPLKRVVVADGLLSIRLNEAALDRIWKGLSFEEKAAIIESSFEGLTS